MEIFVVEEIREHEGQIYPGVRKSKPEKNINHNRAQNVYQGKTPQKTYIITEHKNVYSSQKWMYFHLFLCLSHSLCLRNATLSPVSLPELKTDGLIGDGKSADN